MDIELSGCTGRRPFAARLGAVLAVALLLSGCGDDAISPDDDSDGDGIRNGDEAFDVETNTDGDAFPDWLDLDSDGDGLTDAIEAGDADPLTPPVDTDGDGIPDFLDTDSDGDGVPDAEGVTADGTPIDSDMDGVPDVIDDDDDGDGIPDRIENVPALADTDGDGIPDRLDTDSDGDGIPDAIEGSGNADGDGFANFRDLDSDGDGLPDAQEDPNGNGIVDSCGDPIMPPCESSPTAEDTDGDGVVDLVERVAGTDPNDATSTIPEGDFYFVLPFQDPPQDALLDFSTTIRQADVFFSVDATGSFGEEIAAIQDSIETLIVPGVSGVIDNPAFGVGRFEDFPRDPFGLPSDLPFELLQAVTTDVGALRTAVDTLPPAAGGLDTPEAGMEALYQWATGLGIPELEIAPFSSGDVGGAGFRSDSLPIFVHITDARSHLPADYLEAGITVHDEAATLDAVRAIGGRIIGVRSTENLGEADDPRDELERLAIGTNALIPPTGGACATGIDGGTRPPASVGGVDVCPLVFDVNPDGSGLGDLIVSAIEQLASFGTLDISAVPVGELRGLRNETLPPGTTTADFINSITPEPPPPAGAVIDGDVFRGVTPGGTVTFRVEVQNDFVPHTSQAQLFQIFIHVLGDGVTLLDVRNVFVVVPPEIMEPILL